MSRREQVLAVAGGLAAGLAGGLFGVGGGVILVPILLGVFAIDQHRAHGTSLAVIGASAVASLAVYAGHGQVAWWSALLIGLASAAAAPLGARAAAHIPAAHLRRGFAAFLLLVALRLLWGLPEAGQVPMRGLLVTVGFDLALGALVGVTAGFMGVGGGILAVPALTLVAGMPQQLAQGTSLAVILFAAPFGAWEHSRHGNVVWRLVPALALGAVLGGPVTAWLANQLPGPVLARGFAALLLVTAVRLWQTAGRMTQSRGPSEPEGGPQRPPTRP